MRYKDVSKFEASFLRSMDEKSLTRVFFKFIAFRGIFVKLEKCKIEAGIGLTPFCLDQGVREAKCSVQQHA